MQIFTLFHGGLLAASNATDRYAGSVLKKAVNWISDLFQAATTVSYENMNLGASGESRIRTLAVALIIGSFIAILMTYFRKRYEGRFVQALLKKQCHSESDALTLRELGFYSSLSLRKALTGGMPLRRTVFLAGEENELPTGEENGEKKELSKAELLSLVEAKKPNFEEARFYIPEDLRIHAEFKYAVKGSDLLSTLLSAAGILLAGLLMIKYLPELLAFLDRLISIF